MVANQVPRMRHRRGSRFQFSNADVVGLIPERLSTDVPPHPHIPARERRTVLVEPVRPLSFDRHEVQRVRTCGHHHLAYPAATAAAIAESKCTGFPRIISETRGKARSSMSFIHSLLQREQTRVVYSRV